MSYNKALKKLEALPPGERQLAAGQYVWEVKKGKSHCGCAIGKLLTEKQRVRLFKHDANNDSVDSLRDTFLKIETGWGRFSGNWHEASSGILDLTNIEADRLQGVNDRFATGFIGSNEFDERNTYANRKARYKHVIVWLREQIANQVPQAGGFDTAEF